ncbi:MAG: hypothetical protein V3W52_17155 [Syntrophobacteria bacterium]
MRTVIVSEWYLDPEKHKNVRRAIGEGLFHRFGSDYEEFETGPGNFTTAIVEMPDGSVLNIEVSLIAFKHPSTSHKG